MVSSDKSGEQVLSLVVLVRNFKPLEAFDMNGMYF